MRHMQNSDFLENDFFDFSPGGFVPASRGGAGNPANADGDYSLTATLVSRLTDGDDDGNTRQDNDGGDDAATVEWVAASRDDAPAANAAAPVEIDYQIDFGEAQADFSWTGDVAEIGARTLRRYTSGSDDGSGFNINIVFRGTWSTDLQQAFIDASELFSEMITGDVPDEVFRNRPIDDVKIVAKISDIDGPGGILGQAGPQAYRTDTFIPVKGTMEFDVADAENYDAIGMFNDIVWHEMAHVLGMGTMWNNMGLVDNGPGGTKEFNGTNANIAFAAEFGAGPVSIETEGGPGTAGGHWNEDGSDGFAFENEIMTGFIDPSGNYLSNTTVAAFEDMGYETVFDAGDPLAATSGLDLSIFNDHISVA